ncbi:Heat-labile enterotoxin IIA, A chain [Metarhizium brunneum]|uniref:Heat-labile enterotoxin IIA, A chain n=1 Tax=Metarhizium brunneum TaxID=500148 RepID=A0A7D5Z0W8_9HYPO
MKASPWVSIAAPLLLFGLCQGHLKPGHSFEPTLERRGVDTESGGFDDEFPRHVYRGEIQRTPKEVQKDGGFYSRGMQRILSGDKLSWEELEDGSSLFRHAAGDTAPFTRYVSTSADPATSLTFAVNDEDPVEKGYIYKIHADKRMVDVNRSLGKYSPYPAQTEHAAIGFIPFEQIEGWWEVTYKHDFADPKVGKKTQDKLRRGQLKHFHRNPHFSPNFQKLRGNGVAPQLAGFPRLSTAWDEDTWKQFKTLPVSKSLDDMIEAVCTGNGNDNCIKQLGQPQSKPTKPKTSPSGPIDPAKPKSLATSFRVYAKAGTLVGFNVLAPYLRNVLNQLRQWDHPIGWAVKELDDSINGFQEYIGGPRRNDISGNDNQAALINFFKRVFWILEGPRRRPQDLQLLSYGKRNKMRLISVNDVLRTCERVDETPPDEQQLKTNLKDACTKVRKKAMELEMPTAAELEIGRAACGVCGLAWSPQDGQCKDKTGAILWPREPPAESTCTHHDSTKCGGEQTAAQLQTGQAVCGICGSNWYPDEGKCRDAAGVLLWPFKTCSAGAGRIQCEGGQTTAQRETGQAVCKACGKYWDPEGSKCRDEAGMLIWPPQHLPSIKPLHPSEKCRGGNDMTCQRRQIAAEAERGRIVCGTCRFSWDLRARKCRDNSGAVIWPPKE